MAGARIYVQEGIHDNFLAGFTKRAQEMSLATGGPFEEGTRHGPQVSQTQFDVNNSYAPRYDTDFLHHIARYEVYQLWEI
jgi:acyl-CoA reductase-like NAD-dependent aldehyde dehydrogenase